MSVIIQHKRGTASQWTSLNPTLEAGEVGWESDTNKFKIGTGSTVWTSLGYATLTPSELTSGYARLAFPNAFTVGGHSITNDAAGTIPLYIRGASGQSGDMLQIQNNGAVNLAVISSTGTFRTSGLITAGNVTDVLGQLSVYTTVASRIGAVVRGAASQSANLQEWQDSAGTMLSRVTSGGSIVSTQGFAVLGGASISGTTAALFQSASAARIPVTVQGAASQSANLQEWQNSAGTVLANITSGGNIVTTAGLTIGTTATVNGNFTTYGTSTLHANQQLSLAVRNGLNYTGNLIQYSINDTTVTGGVTAKGLLFAGSTGFENNSTYNLSATNPFLTSSTATFTVSTVQTYNPFAAGQKIIVSGASQAQYNGSWITTAVGGSSGAWTVTIVAPGTTTPFTNSGALTATGTIAVEPAGFFKQPHPGAVGLVIKGAGISSTATDIFRYINSSGSTQTYITAAGDIVAPAISAIWSITSSAQDVSVNAIRARHSVANYRANLQTWENTSTVLAGVNAQGQFFTGGTTPIQGTTTVAINTHTPTGTTDISITTASAHGISVGQTVVIAGITPAGYNGTWVTRAGTTGSTLVIGIGSNPGAITVAGTVTQNSQVGITALSANNTPLVVRAAASQSANILELQSSAGAILGSVSSVGNTQLPILGVGGTALSSLGGTLRVMNSGSGAVGMTIRGASGQSVDLLQIQNNTPSTLLKVDQNGFLVVGGSSVISNALISSTTYGTTQVGLAIRGTAGQTANLTEWQDSVPSTRIAIDSTGRIVSQSSANFGGFPAGTAVLGVRVSNASTLLSVFQGATSQTADLNQYQNSSSTVLGGTNAVGQTYTGSTAPILTASGGTIQSIAAGANPLVTMASAHGFTTGDLVTLAGTTGGTYNGTFVVASTPASTTFTITSALTTGQAAAGGTASDPAQVSITARSVGTTGLILRGAASQSANLQSWQLSDSTEVTRVRPGGQIGIGSLITGTTFAVNTDIVGGASSIGAIIRGSSGQTANLTEWQTNTPTTVAFVSPSGGISATGSFTTPSTSFDLVNTTATTVNFAGAATTLTVGGATGGTTTNVATGTNSSTGATKTIQIGSQTIGTGATQLINIGNVTSNSGASTINIGSTGSSTIGITGTTTNTGSLTATGDISTGGVLKSTQSSGDEGGQIDLTKSVTNTTLTTGVSIDVNQNRLRFFETGSNTRGYYLDIAAGGNTAATLIQARAWVFSNANATAATTNTSQSIFQAGARSYSLDAATTYYFRLNLGVNFTFSAVPAAIQLVPTFSQVPVAINYSAVFASGTSGGVQSFRTTSTSAVSISPTLSATVTGATILIEGFFQSNATTGGTVEFKYQISTGGGSSATATTGSLLQIQKIGTGAPSVVSGTWA